jgi:hypothetical protein
MITMAAPQAGQVIAGCRPGLQVVDQGAPGCDLHDQLQKTDQFFAACLEKTYPNGQGLMPRFLPS